MNNQLMERFDKAIRTSQKPGGGIYVEAQVAIDSEIHTYGQFYKDKNVPEAVEAFKAFYFPLFVTDAEEKGMTTQKHVDKVHLIIDNTQPLYERKIAIFKVYEKSEDIGGFINQLRNFAEDAINATNLSETSDPMISGLVYLQVGGHVYADLIGEYIEGEWK